MSWILFSVSLVTLSPHWQTGSGVDMRRIPTTFYIFCNLIFLFLLYFPFILQFYISFHLNIFFCYVVMRQLVIVLKVVGCNSNTNKNNDFVLKERMKWYHKSRDLNERKKKDFYSVLKRWWIMKFTLPKIGVNTYISLKK
jgi:hypothetical protein